MHIEEMKEICLNVFEEARITSKVEQETAF